MKVYRVRSGHTFPRNRERGIFYRAGTVFAADEEEIRGYEYMLAEVQEVKPEDRVEVMKPRRRGRPPMLHAAIKQSPEDRGL